MPTPEQLRLDSRRADAATLAAWSRTVESRPVLVVDDEAGIREVVARWLERHGYTVRTAASAEEALERMKAEPAAVALCDVRMPGFDGLWLLDQLRIGFPATAVVMATGFPEVQSAVASLRGGVIDYLTKPFTPERLADAVRRAMDWHMSVSSERRWAEQLEREATGLEEKLREAVAGLDVSCDEAVNELLSRITAGDEAAYAHARRVASLSVLLCDRIGRPDRDKRVIRRAALLHDVGKSAVPPAVIHKPAPLGGEEYELVRTHPLRAWRLLHEIPFLSHALPIVRSVHERPDGCGFPDGLSMPRIPLGSRIVAIANAYDAMTTLSAYRSPLPPGEALNELERGAGPQFDALLVPLFVSLFRAD